MDELEYDSWGDVIPPDAYPAGGCQCNECVETWARARTRRRTSNGRCALCGTTREHFDALTEQFVCDHDAAALIDRNRPVVLDHYVLTTDLGGGSRRVAPNNRLVLRGVA